MIWTTQPRFELTKNLSGWRSGSGSGGENGELPSLILIHGVGLRAESWRAMLPLLTPHFRVTVPTFPVMAQALICRLEERRPCATMLGK